MQRGGWGGKAVRKGAGIVAGAAGRVAGELASYSNLEE